MGPNRNWKQAIEKRENEANRCRHCHSAQTIQLAHIVGREHDRYAPIRDEGDWKPWTVHPDRVVPLCGPVTDPHSCHALYDAHRLDLAPVLTEDEVHQAIADCARSGRSNGFAVAYWRIVGSWEPVTV